MRDLKAYSDFDKRVLVLRDIILLIPKRLLSLVFHLLWFLPSKNKLPAKTIIEWILDLPFYILDLFGIGEIYQFINLMTKPKMRRVNIEEDIIINEVFDDCIDIHKVWIDDKARLFTNKFAHAYVTTNIINYWKEIGEQIFVHELVHVCQYQKFGSVYISRALRGQYSHEGYEYGGAYGLAEALAIGKGYLDFNFEQQAQIIEDYYEVNNRLDLLINPFIVNTYRHYYQEMLIVYKK